MSTDSKPSPIAGPRAPKGGIKIKNVRFVTSQGQGIIIGSPREAEEHLVARVAPHLNGYDIFLVEDRQAFRFDRYADGAYQLTKWMHVSQVRTWEEWNLPEGAPGAQSSSTA